MKAPILLAALLSFAFARPAHATSALGYPCMLVQVPSASPWGNSGYAQVSLYSGPACTGSYVATVEICSGNATNCGTSYSNDTVFAQIVQNVQAALTAVNQRIYMNTSGTSSFLSTIYFYAAGY